ncbi:MAG: TetR/AcrR family transcriptional regulator, partial [Desulfosudaceae bacterium]
MKNSARINDNVSKTRKSLNTRKKILAAARRVFSRHPYKAATVRMIAAEGEFDHPLIRYYFPTKADLFAAVVADACEEYYQATLSWFAGLDRLSPQEGLSLFIDRLLDYSFNNPEFLKILAINSVLHNEEDAPPGYDAIPRVLARTHALLRQSLPAASAGEEEIEAFANCFDTLIVTFLGAGNCQAMVLGMDPAGEEYRQWIKQTLLYVFAPLLK